MARVETRTKYEIVRVASEYYLTIGYSNTSPKMIAKKLNISPGNITYYFPSKEHLLLTVVEDLCDFQWKMLEYETEYGFGSAESICLETMSVAVACEESEIAKDFFVATFQSELCRNYLRQNHVDRAKKIFREECADWTDQQFRQAELLIMGLQHAAIAPTDADIPLKMRIAGVLNQILSIYNVDEATRQTEIQKVLDKDCRELSRRVLEGFTAFVKKNNAQTLKEMEDALSKKQTG